jgi:fibronectin-binding autotransporter adhesin
MTTKTIAGTITGGYTLSPLYAALSVTATGLIKGGAGAGEAGVTLPSGGELDNAGRILGGSGAYRLRSPGGVGGAGVTLAAAGMVSNLGTVGGGVGGSSTYVQGGVGGAGLVIAAAGTVDNQGAITGGAGGRSFYGLGGAGGVGVTLGADGTVYNTVAIRGGAGGLGSLYGGAGGAGVALEAGGTVDNMGAITGGRGGRANSGEGSKVPGTGIDLGAGGFVTNGSASASTALIAGGVGVYAGATGAATLTNYGVIKGSSGVAVAFKSASDRLIAEAGSSWVGSVEGGGGTLDLASGAGTIAGLGATATISGAEAMTFSGFATYQLDAGTQWILAGANSVASGSTLIDDGSLTITGPLTGLGTFAGAGVVAIADDATLEADGATAATLTVAFGGDAATLALGKPRMFDASISGLAASDTIDLLGQQATRAKVDARGRLVISDGAARVARLQLSGDYAGATFAVADDGHGGTDITVVSPAPTAAAARPVMAPHALIAAMAGLGATAAAAFVGAASFEPSRPMLLCPRPIA